MKNRLSESRLLFRFLAVVLMWLGTRNVAEAQGYQPLGIQKGIYKIAPHSTIALQVYCLDKTTYTTSGNIYDAVIGEVATTLGNTTGKLQDRINDNSLNFEVGPSSTFHMTVKVTNNTAFSAEINVHDNLVLTTKTDPPALKDISPLNQDISNLKVGRQEYIWFSHFYDTYLHRYGKALVEYGVVSDITNLSKENYILQRNWYLKENGISNRTLIGKNQSEYEHFDYALRNLLLIKEELLKLNQQDPTKYFHLRYKRGDLLSSGFYLLDDGSTKPFSSISQDEIINQVNARSQKAVICFGEDFPADKRNAFISNFRRNGKQSLFDVASEDFGRLTPMLAQSPDIISVTDDSFAVAGSAIMIDYRTDLPRDYNLKITSSSNKYLLLISNWFKKHIGKSGNPSVFEIYLEAKKYANQTFTGQKIKTTIMSNYRNIGQADIRSKPFGNTMSYVYIREDYQAR